MSYLKHNGKFLISDTGQYFITGTIAGGTPDPPAVLPFTDLTLCKFVDPDYVGIPPGSWSNPGYGIGTYYAATNDDFYVDVDIPSGSAYPSNATSLAFQKTKTPPDAVYNNPTDVDFAWFIYNNDLYADTNDVAYYKVINDLVFDGTEKIRFERVEDTLYLKYSTDSGDNFSTIYTFTETYIGVIYIYLNIGGYIKTIFNPYMFGLTEDV